MVRPQVAWNILSPGLWRGETSGPASATKSWVSRQTVSVQPSPSCGLQLVRIPPFATPFFCKISTTISSLRLAAQVQRSISWRLCASTSPSLFLRPILTAQLRFQTRYSPQRRPPIYGAAYEAYRYKKNYDLNTTILYGVSVIIAFLGLSYAAVPFYKMFCQRTGLGGTVQTDVSRFTEKDYIPVPMDRRIRISFNADRSVDLPWNFVPEQSEVCVLPGETALAFFKAENTSNKDVIGISAYNIAPAKAGIYFNKIQCFCFEEQMLRAGESVDMPVFFFIDPSFAQDSNMKDVQTIVLSYTFFESRDQSAIE